MSDVGPEPTGPPQGAVLAILGYHKIGAPSWRAWETWYYVPEATFIRHLEHLRNDGWHVIDLATLLRGIDAPEALPRRAALITFDDGYRSVLKVALPCLLRFGYPAVHFVPTDFIGRWNRFDRGAEPREAICGWDELRELERRGVAVQPHGASHRSFSGLSRAAQERELRKPKEILEAGLGRPAEFFSFPYGDDGVDPAATEQMLRQAGYRAACLYGGGPVRTPIKNAYRLTRLAMGPDTDLPAALAGLDRRGGRPAGG
jgi:peptidoglycan/xylan/chitin deacetylase (PgdA/CDA1 family)